MKRRHPATTSVSRITAALAVVLLTTILNGCGNGAPPPKALTKEVVVTNWFAEPEHGGLYAALEKGFYKDNGLDMTIEPGGPQVSSILQVTSGKANFGMAQGDELLVARKEGIPVVGIFADFQKDPQAIMYHSGKPLQSFNDLSGRTVYVAQGAMYWEYLKKAYKLNNVKEMAFTGNYTGFINDSNAAIQSYTTSDPYIFKTKNVDVQFLPVYDSGYRPYANVLFTTEKIIKEKPEVVKAFVEATAKGWTYYKTGYEEINPVIHKINPEISLDSMKATAESEMDLIFSGDAVKGGVGTMTEERWMDLAKQLVAIGIIPNTDEVKHVFTTKFIPKPE
ncbi:ABC transporter substrate-binding protein [Paenibacillus piri]|uniref:Myristoyl transferase n=1 Tax=Paenibacillus piri TaxID=2547395 RepID=A0A4R5KGH4_9BACL|nr:ABC transporter substrate-binding protein [Paenibacillus piri]TDF94416.1 myristoyl transferase [Paenibacillus piri]